MRWVDKVDAVDARRLTSSYEFHQMRLAPESGRLCGLVDTAAHLTYATSAASPLSHITQADWKADKIKVLSRIHEVALQFLS